MVIGAKCKPPPPRGKASWAPKIRIGTTGASVFAITSPNPGSAGCKLPSRVREPSGKTSAAFPDLRRRIEITLMVHRENHRTALNHALPMNYAKTKKKSADQARKIVTKPVIDVHR